MGKNAFSSKIWVGGLVFFLGACEPVGTDISRDPSAATPRNSVRLDNFKTPDAPAHGQADLNEHFSMSLAAPPPPPEEADASTYEEHPLSEHVKLTLNVQGFEKHLASLYDHSHSECALGVRKMLEKLFDAPIGGQGDAYEYDVDALNRFAAKKGLRYAGYRGDTPPFQDFDIRVLQPKQGGSRFGHIEIFYAGRWYSDFKEHMSVWDSSSQNYSSMALYRLGDAPGIAMYLRREMPRVLAWFIPEAQAETSSKRVAPSQSTVAEVRDASGKIWRVVASSKGEIPTYLLYRISGAKDEILLSDPEAFFLLLEKASSGMPAAELADDFLRRWIKTDGKQAVQAQVSKLSGLVEVQRDAFVRNGLQLPKKYNLIMPNKD